MIDIALSLILIPFVGAMFILGIFWAANHTWVAYDQDGVPETKGLVLWATKKKLHNLFLWLDKNFYANLLLSAFVIITPPVVVLFGFLSGHIEEYLHGVSLVSVLFLWVFFGKKFSDIGVFVLACYRCMPTFWFGIPLGLFGLGMFFKLGNPDYILLVPAAYILVALTSFWTTTIKSFIE